MKSTKFTNTVLALAFSLGCAGSVYAQIGKLPEPELCNEKCLVLMKQAFALDADEKYEEAIAAYEAAGKADPKASLPLSAIADIWKRASTLTAPELVEEYRKRAKIYANKALAIDATDVTAQTVLRELLAETPPDPFANIPAPAINLFGEAEKLFAKQDFKAAKRKYQAAFALAPQFAKAILYVGDCDFEEGNNKEAEAAYKKALEIDPLNDQAWRFLAGVQNRLGYPAKEIEATLFSAISAHPDFMGAWDFYENIRASQGAAIRSFRPIFLVDSKQNTKNGEQAITLYVNDKSSDVTSDLTTWSVYAAMLSAAKKANKENATPFAAELQAWRVALRGVSEGMKKIDKPLADPTLQQFAAFEQAGQLPAAIFVFHYQEAFRPEFEAWKKANPGGIQKFVETFKLRPVTVQ